MKKLRRAFTLIELLCVVAIIAMMIGIVAMLNPSSPVGLDGATRQAQSVFSLARAQAMLASNPDPEHPDWKLYTPRARVLILNDPQDKDNHLRKMMVVVGGQLPDPANLATLKSEKALQEGDLKWYNVVEASMLPAGIYFVADGTDNQAVTKAILRSDMMNKTFPSTPKMQLNVVGRKALTAGSGPSWFYYEFLASGAANMTDRADVTGARFMLVEAQLNPGTGALTPIGDKKDVVGGFLILRPGNLVPINKISEAQ